MYQDIRGLKQEIRQYCRDFRIQMTQEQKTEYDAQITKRAVALWEFSQADLVCTYVSKPLEVNTFGLITAALNLGKCVAVPRCLPGTREMEFRRIASCGDLLPGAFGVLEPDPKKCPAVNASGQTFCAVPGFSFDTEGFRLGYGKGYYDRFLADFCGFAVGLCYTGCVRKALPHGRFDCRVDALVTERYIRRISGGLPGR